MPRINLIFNQKNLTQNADSAKPVSGKVYRLRIKVPAELPGEVAAEVT
jgi:hypothetical protein